MGVETVVDEVEYKKRIQRPYALFNLVLSEDIRYRVESTPVSLTAAKIGEMTVDGTSIGCQRCRWEF